MSRRSVLMLLSLLVCSSLVVFGVAMWSVAAALIVAGVTGAVLTLLVSLEV